jgi:hypothetical protein
VDTADSEERDGKSGTLTADSRHVVDDNREPENRQQKVDSGHME